MREDSCRPAWAPCTCRSQYLTPKSPTWHERLFGLGTGRWSELGDPRQWRGDWRSLAEEYYAKEKEAQSKSRHPSQRSGDLPKPRCWTNLMKTTEPQYNRRWIAARSSVRLRGRIISLHQSGTTPPSPVKPGPVLTSSPAHVAPRITKTSRTSPAEAAP